MKRLAEDEFVWVDHGPTFSLRGGAPACEGMISVVAEDAFEHCTATFRLRGSSPSGSGPAAVCVLGGFTLNVATLPVPKALLRSSGAAPIYLMGLIRRLRQQQRQPADLKPLLNSLAQAQETQFNRFFPPTWGCRFGLLFEPLVSLYREPSAAQAARVLHSLQQCPNLPSRVAKGFGRMAAASAARKGPDLREQIVRLLRGFPSVLGIPYGELVEGIANERGAFARAERAPTAITAAAALTAAVPPVTDIHTGLARHQHRVIQAENANG